MPDDHKLRLGDAVEIDGETWVWEGVRRGTEAKLRRDGSSDDTAPRTVATRRSKSSADSSCSGAKTGAVTSRPARSSRTSMKWMPRRA